MIPLTHDDFKVGQTPESTPSASARLLLTPSVVHRRRSLLIEGPTGNDVKETGSGLLSSMAAATSAAAFVAALAVPTETGSATPDVATVLSIF